MMLAISQPGGEMTRSALSTRPVISARRLSLDSAMMPVFRFSGGSMRGGRRAGRAGEHLVDPDAEPVGADRSDREDGHHDRGQEQESENLHALTAHARSRVVRGRHIRSRLKCGGWDGIRAVALLHFRCIRAADALIWINPSSRDAGCRQTTSTSLGCTRAKAMRQFGIERGYEL